MDRSQYESQTIAELKAFCKSKGLTGYSGLKKKELIDFIVTSSFFESANKTSKAKAAPKTKKPDTKAAPKTKKPPVEVEPVKKTVEVPKATITKRIAEEMKEKSKPSGILYVSSINNAMQNVEMYIEMRDRTRAIENAEEINEYLQKYSFTPQFEKEMRLHIKSVVEAFGSPSTKRKVAKKTPIKKGDYKSVELDVKFGKKGDVLPSEIKAPRKINITLDELRKEIDNEEFIKEYTQSIRDLMKTKVNLYFNRKTDMESEFKSIERKVKKLKAMGTEDRAIRDMYPGFDSLKAFIIDLEDLIELVRKRGREVTEENIKDGLIEAIDDPDKGLNSIIGRENIKNELASQIYSFSKGYKMFVGSFNNMAIYGPAGVGKTAVASVIAFVFSRIGILARDTIKIVTRADLVGQYIGHTAPRTRSVLIETLEGVLFIDEAYQLAPDGQDGRDFGSEAITEIVNFLDKYIGLNIVIVAGYEGIMTRKFMTFNEGLPRRFPYRYILTPYDDTELTDILLTNLKRKLPDGITLDSNTTNFMFSLVSKIRVEIPDAFRNQAGDMLNLSASLNKVISSSFRIKWKNGDLKNNIPIILAGLDDFLETKGFSVYE